MRWEYRLYFPTNQVSQIASAGDILILARRQVLAEAERVEKKHLLTMEAAISKGQTDEMQSKQLQLVLPEELHQSYTAEQQEWLMNVEEFTKFVLSRQE